MTNKPEAVATGNIQAVLDRYFELKNRFEGALEKDALALQLSCEPPLRPSTAGEVEAACAIADVNTAIQAVWPGVPDELLLRGPYGQGRGRLTVSAFNDLLIPDGASALTFDKLARRMAAASDASPVRPTAGPLRLNQVTIPTSDLARSIEFYCGLGLTLIVHDCASGYARLLMPDGGATFSLHVADGPISRSDVVIYFECDDLDERVARLCASGYVMSSMPVDQTWLWREAMLDDPDGQRICLYHAGVNRIDPPWRLVTGPSVVGTRP